MPNGPRKVLMTEELFHQLGVSRVDWGKPDADGFYRPTLYRGQHTECACADTGWPEIGGEG